MKLSRVFSVGGSRFEENKATNSRTSNQPLYLVIYSSFLELPSHRMGSLPLGNKDEDKYDNRLILPFIPNNKLPVRI